MIVGIATRENEMVLAERRASRDFQPICIDTLKSGKPAIIASLGDRPAIDACMKWAESSDSRLVRAVYVFDVPDQGISKIGISNDPFKRLRQIRQNLWCEIEIVALLWALHHPSTLIEGAALTEANRRGLKLRGEWVDMPACDAVELIVDTLDPVHLISDPRTFITEWAPQLDAMLEF